MKDQLTQEVTNQVKAQIEKEVTSRVTMEVSQEVKSQVELEQKAKFEMNAKQMELKYQQKLSEVKDQQQRQLEMEKQSLLSQMQSFKHQQITLQSNLHAKDEEINNLKNQEQGTQQLIMNLNG